MRPQERERKMKHTEYIIPIGEEAKEFDEIFIGVLRKHKELIRCKDCKHRPKKECEDGHGGLNLVFPDGSRCPCECSDPWYNWMPDDDWYCGNAEREEE